MYVVMYVVTYKNNRIWQLEPCHVRFMTRNDQGVIMQWQDWEIYQGEGGCGGVGEGVCTANVIAAHVNGLLTNPQ